MLSSGILDFAIGIVFTFLAVSLAAGAATEAVASAMNWRARTLFRGIKDLLNDSNFDALAGELYQHGLINPRGDGSKPGKKDRTNPSYIDPKQFAAAFLDIIKGLPGNTAAPPPAEPASAAAQQNNPVAALKAAVDAKMPPKNGAGRQPGATPAAPNDQIRNMLHGIIDRATGDEDTIRKELATWFDNAMDRVSGAYKRRTQLWSFIFAFFIAAVLNVSTINVAETLWRQPVDTKAMEAFKSDDKDALQNAIDTLNKLPIGWPPNNSPAVNRIDVLKQSNTGAVPPAKPADATPAVPARPGDASQKIATGKELTSLWAFVARSPCDWDWTRIAGWLITAFATLFGAPFWFDALQQIVRLKGSGPSPTEKGTSAAAGK